MLALPLIAAAADTNEALRLEPNHRGANEYIGWAYLKTNQLDKAEKHLARLEKI
jgi:hypothetical protein